MSLLLALFVNLTLASEPTPDTLSIRLTAEPETLDWNKAHTPVETHLLMNLMEGLVELDGNLRTVPALAKSWTKSPDGKKYTFHLRTDASWSDGVPVKARDFVASWKRLLSASTGAPYAYFLFDLENAENFYAGKETDFSKVGVTALDDRTLEVRLTRPIAHWLYMPTFWVTFPIREDLVARYGPQFTRPEKLVTTGPFTLSSHLADSKIVLKRNPYYYGKASVTLKTVECLIVADHSTALSIFEAGRLDFMNDISPIDLIRLKDRPELRSFPYLKTVYLGFVTSQQAVSNPLVRQAIALAIERNGFGDLLFGGQTPGHSFVPPAMTGFDAQAGHSPRAKSALELWTSIPVEHRPKKLTLVVPNTDKILTVAQYLQEQLRKALKLEISILSLDHKAYQAMTASKQEPLFLRSWSADFPDPDNFLSVFLADSGNNRTGWKSDSFDALITKARGLPLGKARTALFLRAQTLLVNHDTVIIPLYYEPNLALVRRRVEGLELTPLNYLFLKRVHLKGALATP